MSQHFEGQRFSDVPLDFTQFLSGRLGLSTSSTLSMLGSFLVDFQPSGHRPELVLSARPPLPSDVIHQPEQP